jgi:phosphohistidine phosphatase SixA
MRLKHLTLAAVCSLFALWANASDLSDKLASADYVLLMRHALAPGVGDPPNYKLDDCKTQRNLSAEGRSHAVAVGNWLKRQGVSTADVRSSTWCRCKDTAEGLNFKGFKIEPSLDSFFDVMDKSPERTQALQKFIAAQRQTKGAQALILVTHHVNIHAFMGENIGSGDMVLAQVDTQGKMVSYQLIPRPN